METMNLDNLASSLPTSAIAAFEADLQAKFRAAAVSVAALYKSSRQTSKRAYNAGYAAACQDLLLMIQQGVSTGDTSDANAGGRTIERIMDYVEARLDAIKAREEEEDEEDEKEKEKRPLGNVSSRATSSVKPSVAPVSNVPRTKENTSATPLTPLTPPTFPAAHLPPRQTSPSPCPPNAGRTLPVPSSLQRQSRSRLLHLTSTNPKEVAFVNGGAALTFPTASAIATSTVTDTPVAIIPPSALPAASPIVQDLLPEFAGTKRRHATMAADSTFTPSTLSTPPNTRRRTRTLRSVTSESSRDALLSPQDQNQIQSCDQMDVEEEGGRERKRVARR